MIINIYKIAGRLAHKRYSAPLEDVVVPEGYSRKSKVPPRDSFVKNYAKTTINYNIIYVDYGDNYRFYEPLTVDDFQRELQDIRDDLESRKPDDYIKQIAELDYILKRGVLKKNCVNIIANFREDQDITAESVDHDFGHLLVTEDVMKHRGFTDDEMSKVVAMDYELLDVSKNKIYKDVLNISDDKARSASYEALENIIGFIIFKNNEIPESISSENIKKDVGLDLGEDLVLLYNRMGESFKDVKIEGIPLYSYDGKTFTPNKKKNPVFIFRPKNGNSIPTVKEYLEKEFKRIEEKIKIDIENRKGKVFTLW